jgi:hypothetical protein
MMYAQKTRIQMALCALIFFAYLGHTQAEEKGWEKTITLQNGDVILDMSGEWDMSNKGYGPFSMRPTLTDVLTITQKGSTFTAVKQTGSRWVPKGAETIKGELDKNGFKEVYHYIHARDISKNEFLWEPCKWELAENGNKVVLDCGERVKATLTRK